MCRHPYREELNTRFFYQDRKLYVVDATSLDVKSVRKANIGEVSEMDPNTGAIAELCRPVENRH